MDKKLLIKRIQNFASILFVLIVLGVGFYKGPILLETLKKAKIEWVAAGLFSYLINYIFRAFRFKTISENKIKLWPHAVHSASLHGLATYMLPFRTGEFTLLVILKSVSSIPMIEGGRILFKARLLDVLTLGIWIVCAALISNVPMPQSLRIAWAAIGLIMCLLPKILQWIWDIKAIADIRFLQKIEPVMHINIRFQEIVQSLGIWAALAFCSYCAARAVGLNIDIGDIWFLITIQLPLQLIPLQGIANSGNHEGGWVVGLTILGFEYSEALTFALASHALIVLYVLCLGPLALITRYFIQQAKRG